MTRESHSPVRNLAGARRGSVLIMVVAVLGLLAVIGTVYIVSSRQSRSSASNFSAAINLDLAQEAVNNQVRQTIGNSMYDAAGIQGGYNISGALGVRAALRYTMPEQGILNGLGSSNQTPLVPDNTWLVQNLYRDGSELDVRCNDLSLLTRWAFNPFTGTYDSTHPYYDPATCQPAMPTFKVVSEDTSLDDAFIQLLPYSEASGIRYRFGVRILDASRMANLNTGKSASSTLDADPQGTYFNSVALGHPEALDRFDAPWGLITGTGRVHRFDLSDEFELRSYGSLGTDMRIPVATRDWPFTLGNANPQGSSNIVGNARRGLYTTFSGTRQLRPYVLGDDAGMLRKVKSKVKLGQGASVGEWDIYPNWEAYSVTLPGYVTAHVWPPFPQPVAVNPNAPADYYGDQSKLPPPPPPPPPANVRGWVPFIIVIIVNTHWNPPRPKEPPAPDPTAHNKPDDDIIAAGKSATAATNVATAMEKIGGYSHEESVAFAANYLATTRDSWWYTLDAQYKGQSTPTRWLLNGPMFIDDQGICMPPSCTVDVVTQQQIYRPGPIAMGGRATMDLKAEPGHTYIGYAAQPFINEVAVRQRTADSVSGSDDFAVELYNPYNDALNLRGFALQLAPGVVVSLAGDRNKENFVPPRGYFVITRNARDLAATVDPDATWAASPLLDLSQTRTLYLMREYSKRGAANMQISLAAVDQLNISDLTSIPAGGSRKQGDHYVRRENDDPADKADDADYVPRWCAVLDDPNPIVHDEPDKDPKKPFPDEHMTLGKVNPVQGASAASQPDSGAGINVIHYTGGTAPSPAPAAATPVLRLYERYMDTHAAQNQIFYNIGEFNRIPRIAHEIDSATGLPAGSGTISMQLTQKIMQPSPQVLRTQFPREASIYFDFRTPPWMYGSYRMAAPDDAAEPAELPYFTGDLRAMRLLECISFINLPAGSNLIPGQINVNTAPAQVLSMIPVLNNRPDLVSAILAYRWRTTSNDPRIPPDYRNNLYDFTDSVRPNAFYPGYGIRSLGELEIPLSKALANTTSLDQRETIWADVFNLCTVRSDTFVLYGYLEAIKQNPRYSGPFDNSMNWYQTDPRYVTDDPNNSKAPLLRVGRRRWIALLDSSSNANRALLSGNGLNASFELPKIVAAKDLPH